MESYDEVQNEVSRLARLYEEERELRQYWQSRHAELARTLVTPQNKADPRLLFERKLDELMTRKRQTVRVVRDQLRKEQEKTAKQRRINESRRSKIFELEAHIRHQNQFISKLKNLAHRALEAYDDEDPASGRTLLREIIHLPRVKKEETTTPEEAA